MRPDSPKYLEDIRDAAAFVLEATRKIDLPHYLEDRLRRADPETADRIGETPRIVAFRNILAHGYDTIDHEIVWHLIRQDLPELLQTVENLLKEAEGT